MERYGIVELKKEKRRVLPRVKVTDFTVEFGLNYSSPAQPPL
jgi:predicted transcriptional regulator